jgi:ABC-type oligopeptide transport system ATPase subunit
MNAAVPLVQVRGICKEFPAHGGGTTVAVNDVSFDIMRGETFGLAGMSASGKSVVGRIIMNLMKPTAGEVVFEGLPITRLSRQKMSPIRAQMQIVFQNPLASLNPRRTARASLELPLITFGFGDARKRRKRIDELLDLVGLSPRHAQYYPHEFSGGQCQRLGIARALAIHPKFIFLDEPVSALDVSIQAQILNLLKELQEKLGLTYLFVANNLNVLHYIADRVAILNKGKIVEIQDTRDLFTRPREKITRDLLSAMVLFEAGGALPADPEKAQPPG